MDCRAYITTGAVDEALQLFGRPVFRQMASIINRLYITDGLHAAVTEILL